MTNWVSYHSSSSGKDFTLMLTVVLSDSTTWDSGQKTGNCGSGSTWPRLASFGVRSISSFPLVGALSSRAVTEPSVNYY